MGVQSDSQICTNIPKDTQNPVVVTRKSLWLFKNEIDIFNVYASFFQIV